MTRRNTRAAIVLTAIACLALTAAAAAWSTTKAKKVTISVNALPPASDKIGRGNFLRDVAAFERTHPTIHIVPKEGKMDPATFPARLAGGQLENVFYVYFTDPAGLIDKKQTADVSAQARQFPILKQINPDLMKIFQDGKGHIYGVPWTNYTLGLVYSRTLFQKAGLNPNQPPATWAQVRADAKKISALGNGTVGYGDYSKSNTGGWHFTAELYSLGGSMAVRSGSHWKANFNNALGKQVLQQLHDMRWTDNSMGDRQLLEWADLLQMMGAGKLGMYLGAPDNIPTLVNSFKGDINTFGLGAIPNGKATLGGGDGFMFNKKNTAAQNKAALTWVTWEFTNPKRIALNNERTANQGLPVGLPQPFIWKAGTPAAKLQRAATKAYANVPSANYASFLAGVPKVKLVNEPPLAQQLYAILDNAMAKVLTDKNANISQLLSDAESQANSVLAAA
jgi:ABC-type glycerol-3-phosphate transport system substrate-binding protein